MPHGAKLAKKEKYDAKLCEMLAKYNKAFVVHADNVGSKQFQDIRMGLRPDAVVIMGKNTMMKRSIKVYMETTGDTKWECLMEKLVGNVGVIFTASGLSETRDKILEYKVPAPARAGSIAPVPVTIPAGNTGMGPEATNFFQVLNIATKINKGTVEIISDVEVVKVGDKVNSSQAALMQKMKLMPFTYGLEIHFVFDNGSVFEPAVLDISDDDLVAGFAAGLANVAAISYGAKYPTIACVPHAIINGYKAVLAISLATDYVFPLAQKIKDRLP